MQTRLPILHETLLSDDFKTQKISAINEDAYTLLVNHLSKVDAKKTAQPHLIVGESGSGKTFLMKRLYAEVRDNIADSLYPIAIEGKSLFSTDDIWAQCASILNINGEKDSFDAVVEWQQRNLKRLALFIDNFDYYFERTGNSEQYELRGKVNKGGAPVIVATSQKVLSAFTEYDAAFFDGFRITYLKPLSVHAVVEMEYDELDISRLERIMAYMPKTVRSMLIAAGVLEQSDDQTKDLAFLSDHFHSYFQEKYDAASTQVQRILSVLSLSDSGLTLSEIREMTGQENGKISPYLKLMSDQKLINKEAKTPRSGIYYITDSLFRLWLRYNTTPGYSFLQIGAR